MSCSMQLHVSSASAAETVSAEWEKIDLPIDPTIVLLDIGFTESDPKRGTLRCCAADFVRTC
jgi:hypothetical protein